jgi:hypothetical protein
MLRRQAFPPGWRGQARGSAAHCQYEPVPHGARGLAAQ